MNLSQQQLSDIKNNIQALALVHGFQDAKISNCDTQDYFERFKQWVDNNYHGQMSFLERNHNLRQSPAELHPNTLRVISLRYNYLPPQAQFADTLADPNRANISRYALGKDYHKLLRKKLEHLMSELRENLEQNLTIDYRVFVDSAPVLETAFAEKSGLGWKGKHSLIINKEAGSWFFLAEILINLELPIDPPVEDLCGNCTACITICPTKAILANKTIDATRCISYLTIENKNEIPLELRSLIGNRIYGCDDCQLTCPWNRYADLTNEQAFFSKNNLDNINLLSLWEWNETEFLKRFEGSPIRRIGYQSWLRNLAVAIGNSPYDETTINLLNSKKTDTNEMVIEHIDWAINNLLAKKPNEIITSNQTKKLINCIKAMLPRDA